MKKLSMTLKEMKAKHAALKHKSFKTSADRLELGKLEARIRYAERQAEQRREISQRAEQDRERNKGRKILNFLPWPF